MFYDPLNRVYKTEMPDGTFSKTAWTAWQQTSWDQNDTVEDSDWHVVLDALTLPSSPTAEQTAEFSALKRQMTRSEAHYNTPTVVHTDSLARPFYTIQYLTNMDGATPETIESYAELDIVGNRIAVIDGRRIATSPLIKTLQYRYNMLQQVCRQDSIDGGIGFTLIDVAGQPLYAWDADGRKFFMRYDELRRVTQKILNDTSILEEMIYGEGQTDDTHKNLRGQLYEHHDGAGKQWMPDGYDFKGMPIQTKLCLVADGTLTDIDWTTPPTLSAEEFATSVSMDALGRPVQATDAGGNITTHIYDRSGALKAVKLNGDTYVQDIHYDAKGQRRAIWYGNGTKTGYTYDPDTYRLKRLLTINVDNTSIHYNEVLQDLNYYYDAVGNITQIRDKAQQTLFYDNTIVHPDQLYTYDALYRLAEAEGRELIGMATVGNSDNYADSDWTTAHKGDGNAVQRYTQTYTYDAVGNILSVHHAAGSGGYTRTFSYTDDSNRLTKTKVGGDPDYAYSYDARGNMVEMPHLSVMDWNSDNQLSHITAGSTDAYYQYSGGQRIRKVIEKAGQTEERIYLGSFELYRKYVSSVLEIERTTVHVHDDTGRIAMLEVRTIGDALDDNGTPEELKRFVYSNHLQSAALELDEFGEIISYEEYHPYGTTAYQAMSATINATAKRYRFTGKERDEESGLNYHGARYYAPWVCRWISVDPLESKYAPWSSYNYCTCNPINETDSTGMGNDGEEEEKKNKVSTYFINNNTGELLGQIEGFEENADNEITDRANNLSIRSINPGDFKVLQDKKAGNGEVEDFGQMVSVRSYSKMVKYDLDKLKENINEITKDKKREGKIIERHIVLVYDKSSNLFTSIIQDDSKNSNREFFLTRSVQNAENDNQYFSHDGQGYQRILGIVHTHPSLFHGNLIDARNPGGHKSSGSVEEEGKGVSDKDLDVTRQYKVNNYAIDTFDKQGSIHKYDVKKVLNAKGNESVVDNNITSVQRILHEEFNIFTDAIKSYYGW